MFLILAVIYYLLCFGLTQLAGWVEAPHRPQKRLEFGVQTATPGAVLATDN